KFLADRLATDTVAAWAERLRAAGVGAQPLVGVDDLMSNSWVRAHGLSLTRDHGELGVVRTVGPAPRLSRTPVRAGDPVHLPGADAAEILAEIGLGDALARLIRESAIRLPPGGTNSPSGRKVGAVE
ncbi:MAG TPA: CoA transferase, partial [Dehalococcoidia bacterium]|nr:CoA transferase [Dehalococcoidia bacterium]